MTRTTTILATGAVLLAATSAWAHFGLVLPSDDIVTQEDNKTITVGVKFLHPMEEHYMEMARPKQFGVLHAGKTTDLTAKLSATKGKSPDQDQEYTWWQTTYKIRRPGDYTFFLEPAPYWEPAEDKYIVHYTKVCVNALGMEAGWDEPTGLPTEIIPLSRPYGLWTGNLFSGQVLVDGKPAANVEVEIEYLNESPDNIAVIRPPADPYVTQVVKTDANGIFHYAMPKAGWWGFAALTDAPWTLDHDGEAKSVELGAVYWVHVRDMR